MPSLDQVVEQIREAAGADFAFVLSRRGRLITYDAPRDMPEGGRSRIMVASRSVIRTENVAVLQLPRHDLVRFGGAAPVDVFVSVAEDGAVLCVVMATWEDKRNVIPSIAANLAHIRERQRGPVIDTRGKKPVDHVAQAAGASPTKRRGRGGRNSVPPPAPNRRGALIGLLTLSSSVAIHDKTPSTQMPKVERVPSAPDLAIGHAPFGRESMEAVERSMPEGFSRGESIPSITVTTSTLGQESMLALEEEARKLPIGSAPDVRVELVSMSRASEDDIVQAERAADAAAKLPPWADNASMERSASAASLIVPPPERSTNPYVEQPPAAKRAADAARSARKHAAPRVTLKLEDADEEILDAVQGDDAKS